MTDDQPMTRARLVALLNGEGVSPDAYSFNSGHPNEQFVVEQRSNDWVVYYSERGLETGIEHFATESDALFRLRDMLIRDPTAHERGTS